MSAEPLKEYETLPSAYKYPPSEMEWGAAITHGVVHLGRAGNIDLWGVLDLHTEDAIAYLKASAAEALPPGSRFEIRKHVGLNLGATKGHAWYRTAGMDQAAEWGYVPEKPQLIEGAFFLVGQFVTPAASTT